jgi:dihydroneopterin aldolase
MDRIRLKDLILFPRLGVTEWEKKGVNKVSADVELYLDLSTAALEDRVSATVDYSQVYGVIQEVSKRRKYHLIESLAQEILSALLGRFDTIQRATVRVRKRSLPFDAHLEFVEVELDRAR